MALVETSGREELMKLAGGGSCTLIQPKIQHSSIKLTKKINEAVVRGGRQITNFHRRWKCCHYGKWRGMLKSVAELLEIAGGYRSRDRK